MNQLHSYHIFVFPFKWERSDVDWRKITPQINTHKVQSIETRRELGTWKSKFHSVNDGADYSAITYYYDFVRDSVFFESDKEGNAFFKHFEFRFTQNDITKRIIEFEITGCKQPGTYRLLIDELELLLYESGVGMLVYKLENREYPGIDDIKIINDYCRRIYPQFLDKDNFLNGHGPRGKFLPEMISIPFAEISESFDYYESVDNLKKSLFVLPAHLAIFMPPQFYSPGNTSKIRPNIDDRMFVCTWIGIDALSEKSKTVNWQENDDAFCRNWYQLIFTDGREPGCGSKEMMKSLVKSHTYKRWEEFGTLYGISRYSFILLSDGGYGRNALLPVLKNIYSRFCILALAQRGAILAFSEKATSLAEEITGNSSAYREREVLIAKTVELHKDYMQFLKLLYFREITAQEQGIELYDMLREKMRIEQMAKDLREEINELHQFVSTLEDEQQSKSGYSLTLLATMFLPVSVLLGIFGLSTLPQNSLDSLFKGVPVKSFWWSMTIIAILSILAIWILRIVLKRKK
jgi:hypothetical protein